MSINHLNLDDIIERLSNPKQSSTNNVTVCKEQISLEEIKQLVSQSKEIFANEPILLQIEGPINILGDIHGQYYDLLQIFKICGDPSTQRYLFLGDYVDRGKQSIETICLLLAYKIKYRDSFFLLRGNHESQMLNRQYGFYDECHRRFGVKIWKRFTEMFNFLPVAPLVEDRIFCLHGGLSPELQSLEQIFSIKRPTDIPEEGLLCDLLWADPSNDVNKWEKSERGVSYLFSKNELMKFNRDNQIDLICRAHQVVEDGYEFFGDRKLITLFSAPDYCSEYGNNAAVLKIDKHLKCSFTIIKPGH